jgi:hypothetical protein
VSNQLTTEIERIQEILNAWLEAIKEDDDFYPKEWALEKMWMDLNILKTNVRITFLSLNHDEDPGFP